MHLKLLLRVSLALKKRSSPICVLQKGEAVKCSVIIDDTVKCHCVFSAPILAFIVCTDVKALCCKWLLLNYVTGKQQEVNDVKYYDCNSAVLHTCITPAKAKCRSGIWYYMVCGKPIATM